ncbi:MAG: replication factor C small subunit [Candidatus Methanospirare jalkutatii]|nr:MAG: replication factor C small subunit [Candidatus Methanospirare jalkutatii]UYZ40421.1 MAG: replication factor C small subunit [Candidatus Methanospirare jalkutatii]
MGEEVWVEKYRPRTLQEIVGQDAIVRNLQSYVKSGNLPHLIFAGPAGVGKTAAAIALARELFGDFWRENFVELNASVAPETPILVRERGVIKQTNFAELASKFFKGNEKYAKLPIGILSIDHNYNIKFMPATYISRHKVDKIAEIRYEGGIIRTSLSHSVIVMDEAGGLVPKSVSALGVGDLLLTFTSAQRDAFLPAKTVIHLLERCGAEAKEWALRNQSNLRNQSSERISKRVVRKLLEASEGENDAIKRLKELLNAPISAVLVREIRIEEYNDFVYDVSVPGSEMFWGGTTPILLHNSDERGIETVRKSIKNTARSVPINAPFKIIFLDEADALTHDAQSALRRTMEQYSETCRFIFSVNLSAKLIEPIQSRCAIFRFKPLPDDAIAQRIRYIASQEKLKLDEDALNAIVFVANGDMRRAINTLQSAAALSKRITADMIYEITATARPEDVEVLVRNALAGKFTEALRKLDELRAEGIFADEILAQMHRIVMNMNIPAEKKVQILSRIGEVDFRISEGANEKIQLDALIAFICLLSAE